ncbi:MAG: hypothetical protein QNJ51_14215 [Calothrix sp. MO_167.B12]|nr:hypothetical protein [Calothrix sp. MO_167.B12]
MKIMLPMARAQAAAPLQWICHRTNILITSVDNELSPPVVISILEIS